MAHINRPVDDVDELPVLEDQLAQVIPEQTSDEEVEPLTSNLLRGSRFSILDDDTLTSTTGDGAASSACPFLRNLGTYLSQVDAAAAAVEGQTLEAQKGSVSATFPRLSSAGPSTIPAVSSGPCITDPSNARPAGRARGPPPAFPPGFQLPAPPPQPFRGSSSQPSIGTSAQPVAQYRGSVPATIAPGRETVPAQFPS